MKTTRYTTLPPLDTEKLSPLLRRVCTDSTRLGIIRWLCSQKPSTQREIGRALLLSNARVHHYMKDLVKAGVVEAAGTRIGPHGIVEKLFKVNWKVWNPLKQATKNRGGDFMLEFTFDRIREIHRVGEQIIKSDWSQRHLVGSFGAYATPRELHQFKRKLKALLDDFQAKHSKPRGSDAVPVSVTFAMLPSTVENAMEPCISDMMLSRDELELAAGKKISEMNLNPQTLERILALG
jgi:DNA-binding Lrp family transcriptional regulator